MEEKSGVVVDKVEEAVEGFVAERAGEAGGVGEDGVDAVRGKEEPDEAHGGARGEMRRLATSDWRLVGSRATCIVQRASGFGRR
jgi:hypothetical protein